MGLFDNLFLDANTAVTINDGIDHSKDLVVPIVDEKPVWWKGDDGTWWKKDPKDLKKDDSLDTLFDADKQDEMAADKVLSPEPPKDIALEIGLGPVSEVSPVTISDTENIENPLSADGVSFDIGGDISFDIGGDITAISTDITPPASDTVSADISVLDSSAALLDESAVILPETSPIEVPESTVLPEMDSIPEITLSCEIVSPPLDSGDAPNNALFSLLNTDPSVSDMAAVEEVTEDKWISIETPSTSLLDMMSDGPAPTPDTPIVWEEPAWFIDSIESTTSVLPTGSIGLSSTPKLKAKLSEFLNELETMEVGDETQKSHKQQQIDMCRQRITEIQSEYEARIQALKNEMQLLEQEIAAMDIEKNHIKNVIETFQKELEVA